MSIVWWKKPSVNSLWQALKKQAKLHGKVSCKKNIKLCLPSGERLHFAMERFTMFHGKIHYFYGHVQLRTVSSPGRVFGFNTIFHGQAMPFLWILEVPIAPIAALESPFPAASGPKHKTLHIVNGFLYHRDTWPLTGDLQSTVVWEQSFLSRYRMHTLLRNMVFPAHLLWWQRKHHRVLEDSSPGVTVSVDDLPQTCRRSPEKKRALPR